MDHQNIIKEEYEKAFRDEIFELIGELESGLLDLEKSPEDKDLIARIFRAMHTIKGTSAMFGFDEIVTLTHDVETAYDLIRNGKYQISNRIISLTLSACDQIHRIIEKSGDPVKAEEIVTAFRAILDKPQIVQLSEPSPAESEVTYDGTIAKSSEPASEVTYRIRFHPAPHIFANGTNPMLLLNELLDLGSGRIVAQTDMVPLLDSIDPEACYIYWDIILTTAEGINAIRDVFLFVENDCELRVDVIDESGAENGVGTQKKLGEILLERGDLSSEGLKKALGSQKRIGEILVELGTVSKDKIESALAEQEHVREVQKKKAVDQSSSIRVPSEKLDSLVNMVGELVTVQSRLTQIASEQNNPLLLQVAEEVERLVSDLRDTTMSVRMLPISTIFSKFKRLVRDLSGNLGKEICLVTEGGETELDKTVIDRLNDPLVHLIRNSVDHGIESPEVRTARGKSREGRIVLSAAHSGASVLIRIQDDGAGLDADVIRKKAIEKGLIGAESSLSERDIFALILHPGLSTAKTVTNVSGRGVGMDVVKRSIDGLQGSIEIESRKGDGTTITLRLPLTLAIIDGLLVEIGKESYVMPLSAIEECVELRRTGSEAHHGQNLATIRGELVPYILLRDLFQIPGEAPVIEQIVTTQVDNRRIGFVVDQIIGQHQTVIKPLGRIYRNVEEISGATVLGDGRVVLILDLPKLVKKAERSMHSNRRSMRIH
jgi:two-component system, chemotaxis family, sensor kinase CheA